jgi:hypothetical protein
MVITKLENVHFSLSFGTHFEPPKASRILSPMECKKSNSYVCIKDDRIIGALNIRRSRSGLTVTSRGTVVRPLYQREGVARDLWTMMLNTERPKRVHVRVISDRGYSLIESMKKKFPKIKWFVEHGGYRKLRIL